MAKEGFIFLYLHSSGKTASGDKAVMSTQIDFPSKILHDQLKLYEKQYIHTGIT